VRGEREGCMDTLGETLALEETDGEGEGRGERLGEWEDDLLRPSWLGVGSGEAVSCALGVRAALPLAPIVGVRTGEEDPRKREGEARGLVVPVGRGLPLKTTVGDTDTVPAKPLLEDGEEEEPTCWEGEFRPEDVTAPPGLPEGPMGERVALGLPEGGSVEGVAPVVALPPPFCAGPPREDEGQTEKLQRGEALGGPVGDAPAARDWEALGDSVGQGRLPVGLTEVVGQPERVGSSVAVAEAFELALVAPLEVGGLLGDTVGRGLSEVLLEAPPRGLGVEAL
jgi:hypothetical protein